MVKRYFEEFVNKDRFIARLNLSNKFEFVPKAFLDLLGYENKNDVVGVLSIKDLLKDLNPPEKIEELIHYIFKEAEWVSFVRIPRANRKEYVWVGIEVFPFKDGNKKLGSQVIFFKPTKEDVKKEEENLNK